ncbi:MAG TPA: aromatic-ring-hydroxylating dioxygenase subunit beta [Caulobacteraceae bacterium]|jgi:p-cumate 2,3-dioxygenase beta subunit|nr:aromatic-ring-hydroxylating dioxygenase subunit beta [Caulobacteraceae bacterium]
MSAVQTMAKADLAPVTRGEVEDFLYAESALLDEWRIDEWFALFAPGATYEVPTAGAADDADAAKALFYIADDYVRLRERVVRLGKREAHAEFPRSRMRRMISNVRILSAAGGQLRVACNLVCYRAKNGKVDTYFGHSFYGLDVSGPAWRITAKRVMLDMDLLYPGKVSILL